jgi:hypothetical protein
MWLDSARMLLNTIKLYETCLLRTGSEHNKSDNRDKIAPTEMGWDNAQ